MCKDASWLHQLETNCAASHLTDPCLQEKILTASLLWLAEFTTTESTWAITFTKRVSSWKVPERKHSWCLLCFCTLQRCSNQISHSFQWPNSPLINILPYDPHHMSWYHPAGICTQRCTMCKMWWSCGKMFSEFQWLSPGRPHTALCQWSLPSGPTYMH